MATLTKEQEQFVEHEVKLRVHDALFKHIDYKFDKLENKVSKIDHKFNFTIILLITSIVIPVLLHYFKLV